MTLVTLSTKTKQHLSNLTVLLNSWARLESHTLLPPQQPDLVSSAAFSCRPWPTTTTTTSEISPLTVATRQDSNPRQRPSHSTGRGATSIARLSCACVPVRKMTWLKTALWKTPTSNRSETERSRSHKHSRRSIWPPHSHLMTTDYWKALNQRKYSSSMETDRIATPPCYTLADRQIAQDVL